uniref:glyceraldehyde-3-phosphate dehydrogenase (phosphorylating) n=1 Tax=Urocitellus parryii TaxID=9999 RepID=A0A8D2HGF0_UROPR
SVKVLKKKKKKKKRKLWLNEFDHIGYLVTRYIFNSIKVDIVVINDTFIDFNYIIYVFWHYSIHGKFNGTIKPRNVKLVINGRSISIFQEQAPANIKGVVLVLNMPWSARAHLKGGAKMAIISASSYAPMFVMCVNSLKIISNASRITNCLAPLAKDTHDNFCILEGLIPRVHAITATRTVDCLTRKLWHDGCGAAQDIIPASTDTANAVSNIISELNRKLTGIAFIVPTPNMSFVNLTYHLEKAAKYDIKKVLVKLASEGPLKGILSYTKDQVVSYDLNSDIHSSTFNPGFIFWYYGEFRYSNRVVDFMVYVASKELGP